MSSNKMKYTLVVTKEDAQIDGWQRNLSEVLPMVDVVWSGICTQEEALKEFEYLIMKQSYEYHQRKTVTKWRTIRLYDSDGKQIAQES